MNLFKILEEIEKIDPEVHERMSPRRQAIKNITAFGSKVAVASLPLAFVTLFKKAYGATAPVAVNDVLNFALSLEYLESYFYNQAMTISNFVVDSGYIRFIQQDENYHVQILRSLLGTAAIASPKFDLTAKGAFPDVLTNYTTFLAVANGFEDTGVRAYKGQTVNLITNQAVLTTALGIHAVEARHASAIRELRRSHGVNIQPCITGSATVSNDIGAPAFNASYAGENNVIQQGVDVTTLPSAYGATTPYHIAVEAFDEPLDMAAVQAAVAAFFV